MLKRMFAGMLAMGICLCMLAAPATAVNGNVLPECDGYRNIRDIVAVGEQVYILETVGVEAKLSRWMADMSTVETLASGLIYSEMFGSVEECEAAIPTLSTGKYADAEHALNRIFTDGEKLYGFNGITRSVFEIVVQEDGLVYRDDVALNQDGLPSKYTNPVDVVRMGKWLMWNEVDQDSVPRKNRLLVFNLETGTVKQAVIRDLQMISAYKDNLLLAVGLTPRDRTRYDVYTYDPVTDKVNNLGELPKESTLRDAHYSSALDMLVYQDGNWIRGWQPGAGSQLLGYMPISYAVNTAITSDTLIYADAKTVEARSIQKDYEPEHSLMVMGGSFGNAAKAMVKKHPDVPVFYAKAAVTTTTDNGEDYAAVLTGEDAPDLVHLTVHHGDFQFLRDKGLLLDLSVYPELKAYVDVLYPIYKDLVTEDGRIYGLPVYANSYNGWFINKKIMQEMGLTVQDIPTNLAEMCVFAGKWNDEYAEKYPHYTLLDNTTNYRERLLVAILDMWEDYCQSKGMGVDLDDPLLKDVLAALDAVNLDKADAGLHQTNPEISDYKQSLIWTGCKTVGNWATYMEDFSDRIFIPMTLTKDAPYICPVEHVEMWAVNAATQEADYAADLLTEALNGLTYTHAYALRSDKTEPLINEYYAPTVALAQKELEELEARVDKSVNKATILKRIEEQKNYMENELMRNAYSVNASAVKNYVEAIQPACFIDMANGFADHNQQIEAMGLVSRYAQRNLTMDEFISRMKELMEK